MQRILSCFTNAYGAAGVWTAVEQVRAAGLDHLELALRGHNFGGLVIPESVVITEKAGDATARAFCEHLAMHGVKVSGCNVGGADLRTPDGVDLTPRWIEFAARWFAVPVVISGAGQPAVAGERRTLIGHLREIGDTAGALGITVALETHKGPTQNAEAMLALIGEIDHPQVRLNFDTGNIAYYNRGFDPADELEKVKHLVRNVHVKDNRGGFEDWYFPAVGEGGASTSVESGRSSTASASAAPTPWRSRGSPASPSPASRHGKIGSLGAWSISECAATSMGRPSRGNE